MQIIIDISDDDYRKLQDGRASVSMMLKAIRNGTPLPKGHGRLGDLDKVKNKMIYSHDIGAEIETYGTEEVINNIFDDAQAIIEADKESEDTE